MAETKQQTAAILRMAADVMIEGGYVKGARNRGRAHCALGAIDAASGIYSYNTLNLPAVIALSGMLPEEVGPDPYNARDHEPAHDAHVSRIATWSNMLCNSAEDVACVMRATAEYLELPEEVPASD